MPNPPRKRKKKTGAKSVSKKTKISANLKRGAVGLIVLTALVLVLGLLVKHSLEKKHPAKTPAPTAMIPEVPKYPVHLPPVLPPPVLPPVEPPKQLPFEVFPPPETSPKPPVREKVTPPPTVQGKLPRVAIIIDDIGYDARLAEKFIDLNAAVTLSILPFSPHHQQIIRMARAKGLDILLHLPMEPKEFPSVNPGPGALLSSMSPDALIRQLNDDIDAVPYIKGINNHMGSRLTASSEQMNQIFSTIRKRNLFFVDSRTTPDTQVKSSARLFQVPYAERDVFLDNVQDPAAIRKQLRLLLQKAAAHGQAIAIGHPHPVTLQILRDELPELQKKVTIVPVSSIVQSAG